MRKIIVMLVILFSACSPGRTPEHVPPISEWMGSGAGYKKAETPVPFVFPRDHGPHPEYESEWWYFTGNLKTTEGEELGYQFTVFRRAWQKNDEQNIWNSPDVYMSHLAVSNAKTKKHYSAHAISRAMPGIAEAGTNPVRFKAGSAVAVAEGNDFFPMRLKGSGEAFSIDLSLSQGRLLLHGDRGLSEKTPGHASYYYSFVRIPVQGQITIEGREYNVSGTGWFDHEYFSGGIGTTGTGWDWFAIQQNDTALMVFRVRSPQGNSMAGTYLSRDNEQTMLSGKDIVLTEKAYAEIATRRYPTSWNIQIPRLGLQLETEALFADQEMNVGIQYWEGMIRIREYGQKDWSGRGYLEMTGYGGSH